MNLTSPPSPDFQLWLHTEHPGVSRWQTSVPKGARELLIATTGWVGITFEGHPSPATGPCTPHFHDPRHHVPYLRIPIPESPVPQTLALTLTPGWVHMETPDVWGFEKALWKDFPRFCLLWDTASGFIPSKPEDWSVCTTQSAWACVRGGENHDVRSEPGTPLLPKTCPAPAGTPTHQQTPHLQPRAPLTAKEIRPLSPGSVVMDFGQQVTGWCRFEMSGLEADCRLSVQYGERLHPDGSIDKNLMCQFAPDRAQSQQIDIPKGFQGTLEPNGSFYGFRYVEISGLPPSASAPRVTAIPVSLDWKPRGFFECSDDRLNRLFELTARTLENNVWAWPMDCSAREKIGWAQDGAQSFPSAFYLFEAEAIYRKWFLDLTDAQPEAGYGSAIAPNPGWKPATTFEDGSPGTDPWWSGAPIRLGWDLYRLTGDRAALSRDFPSMFRCWSWFAAEFEAGRLRGYFGDWLEKGTMISVQTPPDLNARFALFQFSRNMKVLSRILGRPKREKQISRTLKAVHNSLMAELSPRLTDSRDSLSQTTLGMALDFKLLPAALRPLALQRLLHRIQEVDGGAFTSGIVGFLPVLRALSQNGHLDLALSMLFQPDAFSFHRMIKADDGTLWEAFDSDRKMEQALNHISYAGIGAWIMEEVAGIRPRGPGRFSRSPHHPAPKSLNHLRARFESPDGTCLVEWERSGGRIHDHIQNPACREAYH